MNPDWDYPVSREQEGSTTPESRRQDPCAIEEARVRAGEYVLDGSPGLEPVHSRPAEFPRRV